MTENKLTLSPNDTLEFFGPFSTKSKCRLLVENPNRKRICFKIKSNAPKNRILVSPKAGIVEPSQTLNVVFELLPTGGTLISKPPPSYGILVQSVVVPSIQFDLQSVWNAVSWREISTNYLTTIYNQTSIPRSLDTTQEEDLTKENIPYNGQSEELNNALVEDPYRKKSGVFSQKSTFKFQPSNKEFNPQLFPKQSSNVATIVFSSDNTSTQEFQIAPNGQKFIPVKSTVKGKLVQFRNPLTNQASKIPNANVKKHGLNSWNFDANKTISRPNTPHWGIETNSAPGAQTIDSQKQINWESDQGTWGSDEISKNIDSNPDIRHFIQYKALYNYETSDAEGLSFHVGAIILVDPNDEQPDPGWLLAQLNDKKGWVPGNYLEKIAVSEDQTDWGTSCQEANNEKENGNIWGAPSDDWGNTNNEKENAPDNDGWGVMENNAWGNEEAIVDENQHALPDEANIHTEGNAIEPQNNEWGGDAPNNNINDKMQGLETRYEALYDYESGDPESLAFKAGDIILVNSSDVADPGWLIGSLNEKIGWVPENYVSKIELPEEANGLLYNANDVHASGDTIQNKQETPHIYIPGTIPNTAVTSSVEKLMEAMNKRDNEFGNQLKDAITIALIIFVFGIILGKAGF